jgi:hypothetical protein
VCGVSGLAAEDLRVGVAGRQFVDGLDPEWPVPPVTRTRM